MTIRTAVNPAWTLRYVAAERMLVAEAGADETYGFVDVAPDVGEAIVAAWFAGDLDRLTGDAMQSILGRLRLLGAVSAGGTRGPGDILRVATVCIGEPSAAIARMLETELRASGHLVSTTFNGVDAAADFAIVMRTGGSYEDLIKFTEPLARSGVPHVLIDASFHHTLCIGPVVTGDGSTACLTCMTTRLRARWGESFVPLAPAASSYPEFVAALAANEVRNWVAGTSSLVGRVVRLDMRTWQTTFDVLLRSPGCRRCQQSSDTTR